MKNLEPLRHSAAHLLAAAVVELWPKAKLAIGPAIKDGFYYDFDFSSRGRSASGGGATKITEADLPKIEKKMAEILASWKSFQRIEVTAAEAKKQFSDNPYKLELIDEFTKKGEKLTLYKSGEFVDLCRGGHTENPSKDLVYFKLLSIAGAYWRGSEKNPMLTRIYGTVFPSKKELDDFLAKRAQAEERDHKKLGLELGLFTFLPQAPGMPFWYPKGFTLIQELRKFVREVNAKYGYQEISTPLLAKKEVWQTSGHWEHFKDNMFVFDIDRQTYSLKPMNCPQTLLLYNTHQHSWRELPVKLSDLDTLHRYEESGTLNGLIRVREFSQDDAHIICAIDQVEDVVAELLDMAGEIYDAFQFKPRFFLATKPDKALGEAKTWERAEKSLETVLKQKKVDFQLKPKDAAFYGPKIDLHVEDALGRDWQLATIQVDFQMPARFGATYVAEDGTKKTPVMIHRAILGSLERFLGILIEQYAGTFPVWLAPVQIEVVPVSDKHLDYAQKVASRLSGEGFKVRVYKKEGTVSAKIRNVQLQKIPYTIVVGDKEEKVKKVSLRLRTGEDLGQITLDSFIKRVQKVIEDKRGL